MESSLPHTHLALVLPALPGPALLLGREPMCASVWVRGHLTSLNLLQGNVLSRAARWAGSSGGSFRLFWSSLRLSSIASSPAALPPGRARGRGPQLASGLAWKRLSPRWRELGLASSRMVKLACSLGSTLRMRNAGLVSDRRSRFTGHCFSQQRMMSQRAEEGASVFTAFLQAWESETRKPAWRRADLGTGGGVGGEIVRESLDPRVSTDLGAGVSLILGIWHGCTSPGDNTACIMCLVTVRQPPGQGLRLLKAVLSPCAPEALDLCHGFFSFLSFFFCHPTAAYGIPGPGIRSDPQWQPKPQL
uniref:tRNA (Guanine(26)-N(2))-dimethyltransferase n=1 Tax=Sus scrofa TaxID=9823 RepID=A0A480J7S0_PIG